MAAVDSARYGDLCRLCASKTNMVAGISIFESEGTLRQINKKIETCLPIQVHESDDLPKMICENCLFKLEEFFEFRERSLRTQSILITILKQITSQLPAGHEIIKMPQSVDVSSMGPSNMIMIQTPHQLLADNIHNINEIDLSHLQQRDIVVQQEIILNQQNVDINAHSLPNIHLNNTELNSTDLTNQTILVNGVNGIHYAVENMQLIQQQHLLSEQFRLHQDLNLNIINEDSVCTDVEGSISPGTRIEEEEHISDVIIKEDNIKLEHTLKKEYFVDEHCQTNKSQTLRDFEDCNSNESQLVINTQEKFEEQNSVDSVVSYEQTHTKAYSNHEHTNGVEWVQCNMCLSGFNDKNEFEFHYEQHFTKCATCLAVFPHSEALDIHLKEAHAVETEPQPNTKTMKTRSKCISASILKEKEDPKIDSNSESDGGGNMDTTVEDEEDEDDPDDPETDAAESPTVKRKKWAPKECKECGKLYKTNYKLVEHMRKHTGEKPYKCNSCEKAFRSKIGLAQHEAKHTGQYDLSCPTCGKGFQCKSYLMVHQRVHSDVKPYPCTTCGRNFKTKQSLLDHTNRHLGVKPYICDVCGRGFITKGLCKAHQKVHTGLDNRKYSCKVCNKMFVSKSYLQTHLRIHTGEKPFICEVCGKGFLTRVDLRIHSTMHTGEKSFVCEICGKAFARRDALRCHRRSHTGERPYSCDLCGQTFTQFSPMAIHKRLHTGERPYTCEVCGKSFVSRSTMMSHWKKHVR